MANPLSLIRKAGEVASRSKPFYSAVDEALSSLPNKALGEQMVKELLKKGVKPQEIIDRNLDAILGAPIVQKTRTVKLKKPDAKGRTEIEEKYFEVTPSQKGEKAISRADVERAAAENPAPQVGETVLGGREEWRRELDLLENRGARNLSPAERERYNKLMERRIAEGLPKDDSPAKFQDYILPGGENYREVLLMIPTKSGKQHNALQNRIDAYEAQGAELRSQHPIISERSPETQRKIQMLRDLADELRQQQKDLSKKSFDPTYRSHHWEQPNVLAHARVSDRTGPNGEKILHVEEIQSDWHQEGRKKGYKFNEDMSEMHKQYDQLKAQRRMAEQIIAAGDDALPETQQAVSKAVEIGKEMEALAARIRAQILGVPDAPFKSTWHELVMKRLLDDAARNGYDRVVITPGAEQAARYDLSKQVDKIVWNEKTGSLAAQRANGDTGTLTYNNVTPDKLADYIGKEAAEKLIGAPDFYGWRSIEGEDLKVGGEGMKGFYDQIIPSYLNKYGEKWGAKVQPYSYSMEGTQNPLHAFDITPQMREEIVGKGQPLYQVVPPAIGAGALMQEEEPGMKRGGAVNGDAMRMAVWNKQIQHKVDGKNIEHRQVGGAMRSIKAAANALKKVDDIQKGQQAILPVTESAVNLERFLNESAIKDRLYHATPKSFNKFIPGGDNPLRSGPAIWMTPNKFEQPAAHNIRVIPDKPGYMYGNASGKFTPGTNVMPLYASIKNPLYSSEKTWKQDFEKFGGSPWTLEPSNIQRIKTAGFDGIVYRDSNGDIAEVVAFEPTQVKSAIGNRGTYDLTDPDITKAKGGRIGNPDDKQFKAKQLRKKNA